MADSGVGTLAWVQRIVWAIAAIAILGWLGSLAMAALAPYRGFLGWTSIILVLVGGLLRLATWSTRHQS